MAGYAARLILPTWHPREVRGVNDGARLVPLKVAVQAPLQQRRREARSDLRLLRRRGAVQQPPDV